MTFILVFRSICRQRWLRRHKSILLAEILNFQGAKPTLGVGSFSKENIMKEKKSLIHQPMRRIKTYNAIKGLGSIGILFSHMSYLSSSKNAFWNNVYHYFMSKGSICSTLFVLCSGFFLSFTWKNRKLDEYIYSKLKRIYPLTFIVFVLALLVDVLLSGNDVVSEGVKTGSSLWYFNIFANIILIKAFIPIKAVYYSFHGPSWYISVLFWFYLIAFPVVKGIHSQDREKYLRTVKIVCICAYSIELAICVVARIWNLESLWLCYVNPWFRIFGEGFAGILLCEYMEWFTDKIKKTDLIEIISISSFVIAFLIKNIHLNIMNAWIQVFPMAFLLIAFNKESGVVSKLLCRKFFQMLGDISFELYMTHAFVYEGLPIVMGVINNDLREWMMYHAGTRFVITFILCLLVAYIVHILMKNVSRKVIYRI